METGYYFRRGDAGALAAALLSALNDPARGAREAAGLRAVAPHTYAARAERILALAEAVVQRYGTIAP